MSTPIRVLIVDDHAMVRVGLARVLGAEADLDVVGHASNGHEALRAVAALSPDVVLMDLAMPVMDGVEATRRIVEQHPRSRVLVLTSFNDPARSRAVLAAGAVGFLLKDAPPITVTDAIRAVARGGSPMAPRVAKALLEREAATRRDPLPELTDRERDVLTALAIGGSNKQIGRRLGISEKTVKAHLSRAFERLGVADRTQAALWAAKHLGREPRDGAAG